MLKVPFGTIRENEVNCVDGRNSHRSRQTSCNLFHFHSHRFLGEPGGDAGAFALALQGMLSATSSHILVAAVYQNLGGTRGKTLADVQTLMLAVRCCGGRVGAVARFVVCIFLVPQDIRHQATILHAHR